MSTAGVSDEYKRQLVDDRALAQPAAPPGTGVPENFHTVGGTWLVGRLGPSPLGWAVPAPASQLPRWAVGGSGGGGGFWLLYTTLSPRD